MNGFLAELKEQRWDDHRYYHHSRINQSLHLVSAISFLVTYVLLFTQPVAAALFGWVFAMCIRQVGHFFFEPKGYDEMNQATHEYKEKVKVGYNLRRKVILHSIWALTPARCSTSSRRCSGSSQPHTDSGATCSTCRCSGSALAAGALLFRTVHLFFLRDVQTGLVWFTKILTDPFHDIMLYHKAPLYLLRGELIEPPHEALRLARGAGQHLPEDAALDRLVGQRRIGPPEAVLAAWPARRRRSGRRPRRSRRR